MMDYGRGGLYSWTTSGEVRRGKSTSWQVCGSMYILGLWSSNCLGDLDVRGLRGFG